MRILIDREMWQQGSIEKQKMPASKSINKLCKPDHEALEKHA